MNPDSELTTERHGDVAIVALRGDHDLTNADRFREELLAAVTDARGVVVDLTDSSFVDSTTLNVLVGARQRARSAGKTIVLRVGAREIVQRVLVVSGLDMAFPITESHEEAVRLASQAATV
jgi:anti-sigma B factor antagonist